MTKSNKKIVLIVIVILLIMTSLLAIFISINIKDDSDDNNQNNNISSKKPIINKEIIRLNDSDEYFAVQNAINYFYDVREQNNAKELITLLNKEYIINNKITEDNVLENIILENDNISFHAEEIYYNAKSNITYYFLKGYIIGDSFVKDETYSNNIYFLLIVDIDNNYTIMPLNGINNIEEYAIKYNIKEIEIDNNVEFVKTKLDEKNKIINYINKFSDLMFLDINKAYDMLNDETKKTYPDKNIFTNNIYNIYNNLFTNFYISSTKEDGNSIFYKIQNRDGDTITITEYYPNDFKIGFEFVN